MFVFHVPPWCTKGVTEWGRGEAGGCRKSFPSSQIFAGLEKSMSFAQWEKKEQKTKTQDHLNFCCKTRWINYDFWGKIECCKRLSYNQLSRGHSRLIQQPSSLRSQFHTAFKCMLNFNRIHKSCMTLMLSTCSSELLKCGWRRGFVRAGSKKKKEPLAVGSHLWAPGRIKGCSVSSEAGNVLTMLWSRQKG